MLHPFPKFLRIGVFAPLLIVHSLAAAPVPLSEIQLQLDTTEDLVLSGTGKIVFKQKIGSKEKQGDTTFAMDVRCEMPVVVTTTNGAISLDPSLREKIGGHSETVSGTEMKYHVTSNFISIQKKDPATLIQGNLNRLCGLYRIAKDIDTSKLMGGATLTVFANQEVGLTLPLSAASQKNLAMRLSVDKTAGEFKNVLCQKIAKSGFKVSP